MTKYILHGGFTREDNESNRGFYAEVVKDIPDGGTLLLCYFASREDDYTSKADEDSRSFLNADTDKEIYIAVAIEENFVEQVQNADAVYIRGGSTNKLMEKLNVYEGLVESFEGKTIAGSSAGAYALSTLNPSHDEPELRDGLGTTPLRVVCHYESPKLPPNSEAVKILESTREDLDIVYLGDYDWKVFEGK